MLSAHNISKSFQGKMIFENVDLNVKPGEITCVIGPSGTGKTTLLRALALLDYPDSGNIEIDDKIYQFPLKDNKQEINPWPHVSVVFQSLFLWPHLSLRENIMLPARERNVQAAAECEALIEFFEMEHFIDNFPNQASIGQRQRVALARALILNPRYLLLDEITSALDVEQTFKILDKLTLLKERGIGMLLITHAINFAKRISDQTVFMADGRIIEAGDRHMFEDPKTERFKNFISLADKV